MNKRHLLLPLLIVLLAHGASAASFSTAQDGMYRDVLLPTDTSFVLNTTLYGNYTVSVYNTSSSVIVENASMVLGKNASHNIYRYNTTLDSASIQADAFAILWRNTSDVTRLRSHQFHVATQLPRIYSNELRPSYKVVDKSMSFNTTISDADTDVVDGNVSINGETVQFSETNSGHAFQRFTAAYTPREEGTYEYSISVLDEAGHMAGYDGSFDVFSGFTTESTTVNVSIQQGCFPAVDYFDAPGEESGIVDLLAAGNTDTTIARFANQGGYDVNLSVGINITNQSEIWYTGDPIGRAVQAYNTSFLSIPHDPAFTVENTSINTTVLEPYTADDGGGYFTSRLYANYTCYDGNTTIENGVLNTHDNFFVGTLEGSAPGGDLPELGNPGENTTFTLGGNESNATLKVNGTSIQFNFNGTSVEIGTSNATVDFDGDLSQLDIGGNISALGPGGDEDRFGAGGDEDRFGAGGSEDRFGAGGDENRFGPGGEDAQLGPEGDENQFGPGGEDAQSQPVVSITLQPLNRTYDAMRGQFGEVGFTVTNEGPVPVEDVVLRPRTETINGAFETQVGRVGNLSEDISVNESVFVQPAPTTDPGLYTLPVTAHIGGRNGSHVSTQYIFFRVREEVFESALTIREAPRTLRVVRNTSSRVAVLVENSGTTNVTNVSAELRGLGDAGTAGTASIQQLQVNETGSLSFMVNATDQLDATNATLVVSSTEGAYSFADIEINVVAEQGIVPPEFRLPLVAIAWTLLLIAYSIGVRLYGLDSFLIKGSFVLLVVGEILLIGYVASDYYAVSHPLLPF